MKATIFFIVLLISSYSYSQNVREDLFLKGKEAYVKNDFKEAALNLFAYREINLDYLESNNAVKLVEIDGAIKYARGKLINIGSIVPGLKTPNSEGKLSIHCMIEPSEIFGTIDFGGDLFELKSIQLEEVKEQ